MNSSMLRRFMVAILCAGALFPVVLLSGCGGGQQDSQVIRVTRNIGGREGFRRHFDAWKAQFEKGNPGWTMELVDLGNVEGAEYYKSRIATGDLPEVLMTWELTSFLADAGHLVALPDGYYEKFGVPLPAPYKGKRYTSQGGLQIQGLVVNKAMWTDAGITEPPKTWDELFSAFDRIKAKGHKPLVLGGREWCAAQPMLYAIASDCYDRDNDPAKPSWTQRRDRGEVRFASDPVMRQMMQTMIRLYGDYVEKGALSDGYNEEQRDFYGNKGATWMMGCWMAGDIEPNQVNFEMEYWPMPSFLGRPPVFLNTSGMPSGWAVSSAAQGAKLEKAMAVMDAYYDPGVYQLYLNGECMFGEAAKVDVKEPQFTQPAARNLVTSMKTNKDKYGLTMGYHRSLEDMVPPTFMTMLTRVVQEILSGNRDTDKLLKMLDDEWDSARKGS